MTDKVRSWALSQARQISEGDELSYLFFDGVCEIRLKVTKSRKTSGDDNYQEAVKHFSALVEDLSPDELEAINQQWWELSSLAIVLERNRNAKSLRARLSRLKFRETYPDYYQDSQGGSSPAMIEGLAYVAIVLRKRCRSCFEFLEVCSCG